MLELNNVEVLYSDVILAVKGISAKVPDASCVTLLGANGAGKSTTLKAISNLIKTEDGRVSAGRIDFGGQAITGHEPSGIVRQGIVHVMEGRKVLRHMSVERPERGGAWDFRGRLHPEYSPRRDGDPDPGEVVWAWVPHQEDRTQGKDRPTLILGYVAEDRLAGVTLTMLNPMIEPLSVAVVGAIEVEALRPTLEAG